MSEVKLEITKSGRRIFSVELGDHDLSKEQLEHMVEMIKTYIEQGERKVFYIDVGNLPPEEATQAINDLRDGFMSRAARDL